MKTIILISAILILTTLAGCGGPKKLLTVDFQKGQTLRYKLLSNRQTDVSLGSDSKKGATTKISESIEMVIAYTPTEVNRNGITTIQATCESVNASRTGTAGTKKEPFESLAEKTFTFSIDSAGNFKDSSKLLALIQETAKQAFRTSGKEGKVKDPDMSDDFIATQWFLWDSVSSCKILAKNPTVGQTWNSLILVPNSMVTRLARNVTYTLAEIRPADKGRLAVITSSYSPAEPNSVPKTWPNQYFGQGGFKVSSTFGTLRNFRVTSLQGKGEQLYNINKGQLEQSTQNYQMDIKADFMFPLGGINPQIKINQTITAQLLK